ncbi:MAG: hypothetical protein J6R39_03455 [Oscillospiraceae bacterium]|nr:hypothetical protein [Oscillospiraceae bacterium]
MPAARANIGQGARWLLIGHGKSFFPEQVDWYAFIISAFLPFSSQKPPDTRRLVIGIYSLQKGSFPAKLCQKAAAGVSLAAAFLLVLHEKSLFLKCFAVLQLRFFLTAHSEDEAILGVLQGQGGRCGEKDGCKTEQISTANRLKAGRPAKF